LSHRPAHDGPTVCLVRSCFQQTLLVGPTGPLGVGEGFWRGRDSSLVRRGYDPDGDWGCSAFGSRHDGHGDGHEYPGGGRLGFSAAILSRTADLTNPIRGAAKASSSVANQRDDQDPSTNPFTLLVKTLPAPRPGAVPTAGAGFVGRPRGSNPPLQRTKPAQISSELRGSQELPAPVYHRPTTDGFAAERQAVRQTSSQELGT
jgi:hypothetical protein